LTLLSLNIYRSSNIGIFLKCNEKFILVPHGLAESKVSKLSENLIVEPITTSIGGSRLLGPLIAMNNKGILVSRLAEDTEIRHLKELTGLPVEKIQSKFTSIGNLISTNDNGIIASNLLQEVKQTIIDVLDAPIEFLRISTFNQVGTLLVSNNSGGAIYPNANDNEISIAKSVLKVEVEPATVNCGVPFVSSGIVVSDRRAVVGFLTSGPEMIILSNVFKL